MNQSEYNNFYQEPQNKVDSSNEEKDITDKHRIIKKIIAISLCSILVITALVGVIIGISDFIDSNDSNSPKSVFAFSNNKNYKLASTSVTDGNIEVVSDISDVSNKVMPSVVSITEKSTVSGYYFGQLYSDEVSGCGSGIIVGENDTELLIVTNNHVVEGADSIEITFVNGTSLSAIVKGTEPSEDLAIVSVSLSDIDEPTHSAISIATIGDSDSIKVGDGVVAIGNALGYGQSVTFGYISAKNREIEVTSTSGAINKMSVLQTDAAINPGNSGGALVNLNGEVIGINSAKLASEEVEGMGYSIPVNNISDVLDTLMNKESLAESDKGFLGIAGSDITAEQSEIMGYPEGIRISEIIKGGGAEKAELKVGDIITRFNGNDINSISDLAAKVSSLKKGTTVKITVMRAYDGIYKEIVIDVTLTATIETDDTSTATDSPVATDKPTESNQAQPIPFN